MAIGNNGIPMGVPDLGARQPDVATMAQQVLCEQAGITIGGSARIIASGRHDVTDFQMVIFALLPMIHIISVSGLDAATGRKVVFPWHSVESITTIPLG